MNGPNPKVKGLGPSCKNKTAIRLTIAAAKLLFSQVSRMSQPHNQCLCHRVRSN